MGGIFKWLAFSVPAIGILLYFALQGQEEIKVEQQVERAGQKIEDQQFDADFAAAWNGKQINAPSSEELAELKAERAAAKQRGKELNGQSAEDLADLRNALVEAGKEKEASN